MPYGADPPVAASGSGYGRDAVQGDSQQGSDFMAGLENFQQGVLGGMAGDVVGAGQILGSVLPSAITDPIARSGIGQRLSTMANRPTQGIAGGVGNIAGAALPFLLQPELGIGEAAAAVPRAGRVLKGLWDIFRNATVPAAVQPAANQRERAKNMAIGTAIGGPLEIAGQGASKVLGKWAKERAANRAADAAREAAQQRAARVGTLNQRIGESNERYRARYDQQRAARDRQDLLQKQAAQLSKQTRDAVPGQTTQNWWREALTPIGEQGRAPGTVGPQASAQVRQIVGDRLNQIRSQMRIGRDDMGFRTEIDGIRNQVDSRLTSDASRDRWSFEHEQKFDKDGQPLPPTKGDIARERNSLWSKYVEQPLEDLPELSGRSMADYVSRLGDLAEDFARQARRAPQAERPELEAISEGLRAVVDVVDRRGAQGNPAIRQQLAAAKRSYHLWSIGNDSVDVSGTATPAKIARTWTRRQGGSARYGAEMDPANPSYHPENARLKQGLERARAAHETPMPAPAPQAPLRPPQTRRPIPVPKVPPERTINQRLPGIVPTVIGHGVTAVTGNPWLGRAAHWTASHGGRGVARPVLGATSAASKAAPAVSVGATRIPSNQIPEITVTAPRYRPDENQEKP